MLPKGLERSLKNILHHHLTVILVFESPKLWSWELFRPWVFGTDCYSKCCAVSVVFRLLGFSLNVQWHWPHPYADPHQEWQTLWEFST